MSKTYGNTDTNGTKKNVKDVVFWGEGDTFRLISKASSKNEQWMKSTKAMEIKGVGCLVQVTTQQGDNVAEALQFVPGVKIETFYDDYDRVISRRLVKDVTNLEDVLVYFEDILDKKMKSTEISLGVSYLNGDYDKGKDFENDLGKLVQVKKKLKEIKNIR
jgi:hypothetical protein